MAFLLVLNCLTATAQGQNGRIEQGLVTSDALATNAFGDLPIRPYRIYLPPSYDTGGKHYPAIYVLHGYGQDERGLLLAIWPYLNTLIVQRSLPETIVVFVNGTNSLGGSFYLNSSAIGDYETYIARDLVEFIDSRYRTLRQPESRAVTGFSMGGWGAMHLALKFPGVFSVVVPVAGFYDSRSAWADDAAKQLSLFAPTNVASARGLPWPASGFQALFAGLLPNAQRSPLFSNYLYETENGQWLLADDAVAEALAGDIAHGDLTRYRQQPFRLRGIKVIHGALDPLVPVTEARLFTNQLAIANVPFEYEEFQGGHLFPADLVVPFLTSHLQGAELYIISPRIIIQRSESRVDLSFPGQAGVRYRIQSAENPQGSPWVEQAGADGNERVLTFILPVTNAARFFRVEAANISP